MDDRPKQRRTRADALRNRERILSAAVDLIIEQGPGTPMELIARRAKVGIATLYRHFADRSVLLRQVALDTMRQCTVAATAALDEEADAFAALTRYMHDAIDLRIGAVLPLLVKRVPMDDELHAERQACHGAVDALVNAAHREGSLRSDITSGDIGLLIIRLTPPLPGSLDPELNHQLSHRHLEMLLDGLVRAMSDQELPGPVMAVDEVTPLPPVHVIAEPRATDRRLCRTSRD